MLLRPSCPVCLEEENVLCVVLSCSHQICADCLTKLRENKCPLCQSDIHQVKQMCVDKMFPIRVHSYREPLCLPLLQVLRFVTTILILSIILERVIVGCERASTIVEAEFGKNASSVTALSRELVYTCSRLPNNLERIECVDRVTLTIIHIVMTYFAELVKVYAESAHTFVQDVIGAAECRRKCEKFIHT